jgi:hypothetical protein
MRCSRSAKSSAAAVVYMRLAQFAAHAGYPLRALTTLKILGALEPELRSDRWRVQRRKRKGQTMLEFRADGRTAGEVGGAGRDVLRA